MDNNNYGVINEIGDLGLGFSPLTEIEQKVLNEEDNKNKDQK